MPSIFLVLTIISGVAFTLALVWIVAEWMKADDRVAEAQEELSASLGKPESADEGSEPERVGEPRSADEDSGASPGREKVA